jgi:hypothetical protein
MRSAKAMNNAAWAKISGATPSAIASFQASLRRSSARRLSAAIAASSLACGCGSIVVVMSRPRPTGGYVIASITLTAGAGSGVLKRRLMRA